MKLISVIIPTYNRKEKLAKAIESAIAQTYSNIEIIVVDDGSQDGTDKYIETFIHNHGIRYYYKKNGGVSSARNLGIRHAEGDYVAFLDSDDSFLPEKLEEQARFLDTHDDFGMVLCECFFVDKEGYEIGHSNRRKIIEKDGFILDYVLQQPSLIPSSVLIRKDILFEVGMFDEVLRTAEDLDLHLKVAAGHQIGLLDKPLFLCTRGGEGLSNLSSTYDDDVYVIRRFLGGNANISPQLKKKAFYRTLINAANGKYWSGEASTGFFYAAQAAVHASNLKEFSIAVMVCIKWTKYAGRAIEQ